MAIKIDQCIFMMTFAADADYHANLEGQRTYLHRETGDLVTVAIDADRMAIEFGMAAVKGMLKNAAKVKKHPEEYFEIESMSHGDHHSLLQEFLSADWTSDHARRDHAYGTYAQRKSIGYWLKNVGDQDAIDAYLSFKQEEVVRIAEKFLRKNGVIDFVWS